MNSEYKKVNKDPSEEKVATEIIRFRNARKEKKWVILGYFTIEKENESITLVRLNDGTPQGFKYLKKSTLHTKAIRHSPEEGDEKLVEVAKHIDSIRQATFELFSSLKSEDKIPNTYDIAENEVRRRIDEVFTTIYEAESQFNTEKAQKELLKVFSSSPELRLKDRFKSIESTDVVHFEGSEEKEVSINRTPYILVPISWICTFTECSHARVQAWLHSSNVRPFNIRATTGPSNTPCFAYDKQQIIQLFHQNPLAKVECVEDLPTLDKNGKVTIEGVTYYTPAGFAESHLLDEKILMKILNFKLVEELIEPHHRLAQSKRRQKKVYSETWLKKISSLMLEKGGVMTIQGAKSAITITTIDRMFSSETGVQEKKTRATQAVPALKLTDVLTTLGYEERACTTIPMKGDFSIVIINNEKFLFVHTRNKTIHIVDFIGTRFDSLSEARDYYEVFNQKNSHQ